MCSLTYPFVRIALSIMLAATLCTAQDIRTVIAEGVGADPQSAAQDAAQNALTNVVGSFIDADKQLEKRTEIRDGIRTQITQIRTDVKEYSQGSIQGFVLVETKKDGPLFRVTAKVSVRVAEFRAFVKKLAEGETSVSGGLFAQMSTNRQQSDSLTQILAGRLQAVVNGEVVRFSVGKPNPTSDSQRVVFAVTATLDEAFLANLTNTLDSVSASKRRVSVTSDEVTYAMTGYCQNLRSSASLGSSAGNMAAGIIRRHPGSRLAADRRGQESEVAESKDGQPYSFCLPLMDDNPSTATVYYFADVAPEIAQVLGGSFDVEGNIIRNELVLPALEIAVLDKDKRELQVEIVQARGGSAKAKVVGYPWLLYGPVDPRRGGAALVRQRTFNVTMKVEDEALRRADSIRVKLIR